jgi:hypothetical protein
MPRASALLVTLGLLATAAASAARAQDMSDLCRQLRNLSVGQWSQYRFTGGGRMDGNTMRMAVVGTESHDSKTYYWLELLSNKGGGSDSTRTVMQMLVPGFLDQMRDIRGVVIKHGTDHATRLPDQFIQMMGANIAKNSTSEIEKRCHSAHSTGYESVTVPAGSFRALHVVDDSSGAQAWISASVPFGLVKTLQKDGTTQVLIAKGSGAKSSITETPTVGMPGMGGH